MPLKKIAISIALVLLPISIVLYEYWRNQAQESQVHLDAFLDDPPAIQFPYDWNEKLNLDHKVLSGKVVDEFTGVAFKQKVSSDHDNNLIKLAEYLKMRHGRQGHRAALQEFNWRGIPQANVIARIAGTLEPQKNKPIIIADHLDSSDMNSAKSTAAILRLSELLGEFELRHDIWFVHLTAKENPENSLGARHFISQLKKTNEEIGAVLLMDSSRNRGVQLHLGKTSRSRKIVNLAYAGFEKYAPQLHPEIIDQSQIKNVMQNSDAWALDRMDYDVVLFNFDDKEISEIAKVIAGTALYLAQH